jgi:multiple sugar transport system permease protein
MSTITRRSRLHRKEHQAALAFVAIPVIGFLLFTLFPLLFSVYASFTNWNGISAPVFKGLDNYTKMFGDRYFLQSLGNTLYMMIGIPIGLVISLGLALAMNRKMRGTTFFRTVYYLPVISSIAAVAILWQWAFNGDFGLINQGLALVGIDGPNWLQDTQTVKPALIIMAIWKGLGYSCTWPPSSRSPATSMKQPRWTAPPPGSSSGTSPSPWSGRSPSSSSSPASSEDPRSSWRSTS